MPDLNLRFKHLEITEAITEAQGQAIDTRLAPVGQRPAARWLKVDWRMRNVDIAKALGVSAPAVAQQRKLHANQQVVMREVEADILQCRILHFIEHAGKSVTLEEITEHIFALMAQDVIDYMVRLGTVLQVTPPTETTEAGYISVGHDPDPLIWEAA